MAYPTGVVFQPTNGAPMGMQPISEASTVKRHELGTIVRATDVSYGEATFAYLIGVASTVAGDVVCFNSKSGATVRAVAGGATSVGSVAVAMSACDATTKYGWYAVSGSVPVTTATVAADAQAYLTSTAGTVDDAASATAVIGMTFKAADSGGFATAQLAFPSIDATALTGTTQTIAGAKTFSGAVAVGGVLTLQDGTAALPSIAFTNSPTTGFYRAASNNIGIATAGADRWFLSAGTFRPATTGAESLGTSSVRLAAVYTDLVGVGATATIKVGTGSPESAVTATKGSLFLRTDGGAGTCLYVKESDTTNTGWKAVTTS